MINLIKGDVVASRPGRVTLMCICIGYEIHVPTNYQFELGQNVQLLTHLSIKETSHTLYGFKTGEERNIFELLINYVGNVGPSTALAVLSGTNVEEFKQAVIQGNTTLLSKLKGIGPKTAERIVLELSDKASIRETWEAEASGALSTNAADAELALIVLGFKKADARKRIQTCISKTPGIDVDTLIRQALQLLS